MKPSPRRQAVAVGLFVTLAVALLVAGILTIGQLNDTFSKKVLVRAVFEEVSGLQEGDNVWFSGVKVGTVKGLAFQAGAQVEVTLRVDQSATEFIRQDAQAKLGSDGLIGSRIVILWGGTPAAPALTDGDVLVTGRTTSSEEIMATLQENNTNLLAITADLRGITGNIVAGRGSLGKLLQDEQLYASVSRSASTLEATATDARAAVGAAASFAGELNRPGGLPHAIVTDRTTWPAVTAAVDDLHRATGRAADLTDGLATSAADPGTPAGVLLHDVRAGADLRESLANLKSSTQRLSDDLEALQHNILLRGFFKKRARAAEKAATEAAATQ